MAVMMLNCHHHEWHASDCINGPILLAHHQQIYNLLLPVSPFPATGRLFCLLVLLQVPVVADITACCGQLIGQLIVGQHLFFFWQSHQLANLACSSSADIYCCCQSHHFQPLVDCFAYWCCFESPVVAYVTACCGWLIGWLIVGQYLFFFCCCFCFAIAVATCCVASAVVNDILSKMGNAMFIVHW